MFFFFFLKKKTDLYVTYIYNNICTFGFSFLYITVFGHACGFRLEIPRQQSGTTNSHVFKKYYSEIYKVWGILTLLQIWYYSSNLILKWYIISINT